MPRPVQICQLITRLIVGGAQECTLLTAAAFNGGAGGQIGARYRSDLITGLEAGAEGSLIQDARRRGINPIRLPDLVRQVDPIADLRALSKLRDRFRGDDGSPRYDIVHTHSSKAGVLGRIAARRAWVPIVVHTAHGWGFHDRQHPLVRRGYVEIERYCARRSDALIVVSKRDREIGLSEGIGRPEDYFLIRSGIELDRFGASDLARQQTRKKIREELGIPIHALVVGCVTRLSVQKAPLDLVRGFARIGGEAPETWFLIVGDGPLRQETETGLLQAGIADRTRMTGIRGDIPELMSAFDLFVTTGLWEGLPRTLPQAMASGLPIVATDVGGGQEAVSEGETGFLVPPGEPEALAERALELLSQPDLRRRMGETGRARAPEFGAEKMVQETDALYQKLIREKAPEVAAAAGLSL